MDNTSSSLIWVRRAFCGPKLSPSKLVSCGANFTEEEIGKSLEFPWHENILMSRDRWEPNWLVKDTHTAFFGFEKLNGAALNSGEAD